MSTTFPDYLATIWYGDGIEFSFLERKIIDIKFEPLNSLYCRSERHTGLKLLKYIPSEYIISYLFSVN